MEELDAALSQLQADRISQLQAYATLDPRDLSRRQVNENVEVMERAIADLQARRYESEKRNTPINRHPSVKAIDERIASLSETLEEKAKALEAARLEADSNLGDRLDQVLSGKKLPARQRADELAADICVITDALDRLGSQRDVAAREALSTMLAQYASGLDARIVAYCEATLSWLGASSALLDYQRMVSAETGLDLDNDRGEHNWPAWYELTASPYFRQLSNKHDQAAGETHENLRRLRPNLADKLDAIYDAHKSPPDRPDEPVVELKKRR